MVCLVNSYESVQVKLERVRRDISLVEPFLLFLCKKKAVHIKIPHNVDHGLRVFAVRNVVRNFP